MLGHRGARGSAARRTLALAAVSGLLLVACKGKEQTAGGSAAGTLPPSGMSTGASTGAMGNMGGAGASASAATSGTGTLSDANILARMEGSDSSEVAVAKAVRGRATSSGVRAYTQMLITDHTKALDQTRSLARKLSITPQPPPNDTTAQETSHLIDRFTSLPKSALDTAFVNHEVEDHQHDIDDTKQMIDQAQNAQVKAALQKSLPTLQKHLDRARQLQKQLGEKQVASRQ